MAKKKRKSPYAPIDQVSPSSDVAYVSFDSKGGMKQYSKALEEFGIVEKQQYSAYATSVSSDTRTSYRDPMTRTDYSAFRPAEQVLARNHKEMISQANTAYEKVGLIKNTIDLMGDFTAQGIRIVHPNRKIEKFYQKWFEKARGLDRSERFANLLFRQGNVIVRSQTIEVKRRIEKALSAPDIKIEKTAKLGNKEIPIKYTFINPVFVDTVESEFEAFQQIAQYVVNVPARVTRKFNPQNSQFKMDDDIPKELKEAMLTGKPFLLDPNKTSVFHYKKDDWNTWAKPMIHSIMDGIILHEKLQLADSAALDGAISNIRIFKLGSLDHKIAPTAAAAARLSDALQNNVGAGSIDLVWGPDIELMDSKTNVHMFLGEEKYKPTLNTMYAGLGIPPTLTGTFGANGTTNNFISLKTLMKRLQYGRNVLLEFWNVEIKKVQEAMGFRLPATIEFDLESLGDEIAEKNLLLQLSDRSLISDELLQRRFGQDPVMEQVRHTRESEERASGTRPPKSNPYNNPQSGGDLQKIGLQGGSLTPGEVGLSEEAERQDYKLAPRRKGEKTANEINQATIEKKKSGQPQQGRPKNSNDKTKRKEKTFKPKTKASVEIWAKNAQVQVAKTVTPLFLHNVSKKDLRSLSNAETVMLENIKFNVLYSLDVGSQISDGLILKALNSGSLPDEVKSVYNEMRTNILSDLNKNTLTLEEVKHLQASIIGVFHG